MATCPACGGAGTLPDGHGGQITCSGCSGAREVYMPSKSSTTTRRTQSGSNSCFPGSTRILTPAGWTQICELAAGDLVLSPNILTGELRQNVILKRTKHQQTRLWRLGFVGGHEIYTTRGHTFRCGDGWKRASAISKGDVISFYQDVESGKVVADSNLSSILEPTYNIVVHGDFTFVAEGAFVHSFTFARVPRVLFYTFLAHVREFGELPCAQFGRSH